MYTRTATVAASVGLHARPAAAFVRAVNKTGLPIMLSRPGIPPVDARSLLAVMTADFHHGAEVEVTVAPDCGAPQNEVEAGVDGLVELLLSPGLDR